MATVTHGSAIVFPSECFDPLATLRAVQDEKCTALYGVPTMFISELELLEKVNLYKRFPRDILRRTARVSCPTRDSNI